MIPYAESARKTEEPAEARQEASREKPRAEASRSDRLVLVGLMGVGKTCVGRKLAQQLRLPFVDADQEIEAAAGCSIAEIFESHGEAAFRDGERRVIARLLSGPACVLATGGGAYVDPATRAAIREVALSVWIQADLDLLVRRTARKSHRPLLRQGNPREILARLKAERDPVYAEADIRVESKDGPPEDTVADIIAAVEAVKAHAG
ncbi:MAG: shikimate kinase [Pseudomonadota bacterium]